MKPTTIILLSVFAVLSAARTNAQWVRTSGPFGAGSTYSLAVSGPDLFAGTSAGLVYHSTNDGKDWIGVGLTMDPIFTLAVSGTHLFAGTIGGGVYASTDSGASWTAVCIGLTNAYVYSLAVSGTNLFAGTDSGGVFLSTNNGASWTAAQNGLTNTRVSALAVSGTNLFAGTEGGVFRSTNNGASWTEASTGLPLPPFARRLSALTVSGTYLFVCISSDRLLAARGVFLSTDNGTSWSQAGLTNRNVNALALSGANLFAGTDGGVFLSTNSGTNWIATNNGLASTDIQSLAVSGKYLFAGLLGNQGVWRRPLSEMITSAEPLKTGLPLEFLLRQNFPNPFNPCTTIKYVLPKSSEVRLSVYDMLGRGVSVLVSERRDAGVHEVRFDASGLSSGVYFYRLQAGDFVSSKRLLLLR